MKIFVTAVMAAGSITGSALAQCGDVYAGTWRNPPFVYDVYRNGAPFQFTPGSFDAPDQTPIAVDAAGNVYHAQTIDAQGTVRVYRNNVTLHTYSARGGPSWVYSGLALAVEPAGSFHVAFYTAANTVTVFKDGDGIEASYAATGFGGSPVGLAWDAAAARLYASIRTEPNQVTVYDAAGTTIATYAAVGVPLAARAGHWYAAVATGAGSVDIYRDGTLSATITGAFSAGSRFPLAVDGDGSPLILVGVSGGEFGLVDRTGAVLYTLPNTAGGGGTGLAVFAAAPCACYANCDASTTAPILNINDFICFQAKFAAGDSYANCDGSTSAPVLNVNDFICFQAKFAAGCP